MNSLLKTTGLSAMLAAAATLPALAEVKVPGNDIFTIDGYVVASAAIEKNNGLNRDYSLFDSQQRGLDAAKFGVKAEYQGLSAYVSALYVPEANPYRKSNFDEAGILDAYVSYEVKNGDSTLRIGAGKFLTYLGYESFNAPDNALMTGGYWASVGGYHSGIRADFTTPIFEVGGAILDSLGAGRGFYEGDGDLHNLGFEAFVKYKGISDLTLYAGIGFDSKNDEYKYKKQFVLDFWASYQINANFNVGAEFLVEDFKGESALCTWILYGQFINTGRLFTQTDQFSVALRYSGARIDYSDVGACSQHKFSVAPTYKLNENFSIRFEASWIMGDFLSPNDRAYVGGDPKGGYDRWFIGAQAIVKF